MYQHSKPNKTVSFGLISNSIKVRYFIRKYNLTNIQLTYNVSVSVELPTKCPELSEKQHVIFAASTEARVGDSIDITCAKSNKLVGPAKIICLSSGEWSAEPKCIPRECMPYNLPENAYLDSEENKTVIETELTILCSFGFNLKGNTTVKCLYDETWSTSPTCEAIDCGLPERVRNGKINNITSTTFNSSLQVLCNDGYTLLSDVTVIICNRNGLWDKTPDCRPVSCGLPTIPENGSLSSINGIEFQAMAVVRCHEGFNLEGNMEMYCTQNGTWTPSPKCLLIGRIFL